VAVLEFGILGPLEVRADGHPVALGGARPRAVFAVLALHANQPVSAERLAVALWGEDAPPSAVKTVQVYVARLRKALDDPDALVTTPAGYRLRVRPGELDAEHFERLVADGREALLAGHAEDAAVSLRQALELWRGPPLAELASAPFAPAEIARLEELRLRAAELAIDADLAAGRHAELIGELDALVAANPLRERLHAQRLLALYRANRQSEALAAYREARAELVEQIGVEPGAELQRLHEQILAHDPALELEPVARGGKDLLPLPELLGQVSERAFVGRSPSLHVARKRWVDAVGGRCSVVLVSGEPGIGKTALAARVAKEVSAEGAVVLYGMCDEQSVVPYQPFAEALRFYCQQRPSLISSPSTRYDIAEAGLLVPELRSLERRRAPSELAGPDSERYILFDAVTAIFDHAARHRPLLLVIDDLHWADRSTLLLLRHVVRHLAGRRMLLLGTHRADAPAHLERLAADLTRQENASRIELHGLDEGESAELITGYTGRVPSSDTLRQWHERTDGHPFFMHEMLRGADLNALDLPPEGDSPRGVNELIGQRLERLDTQVVKTLATAAVIGREFSFAVLEAVAGGATDETLTALEHAIAAGLVNEVPSRVDRFTFSHALVRDSLYRHHTRSRRARLHRQIALALDADTAATSAELAYHFFEARAVVASDRVVRACVDAAGSAAAAMAYHEAVRYYRQALDLLEPAGPGADSQRCDLLLELGTLQWRAGEPGAEESFASASASARARGDARQLALAALAGRHHETGFRDEPRIALLQEALAALPDRDSVLRVRVLARLTENLHFAAAEAHALELSSSALESARRLADPEAIVAALLARHAAYLHAAHVRERIEVLAELDELAADTGHRDLSAHALQWRIYALFELGDVAGAALALERLSGIAAEIREPRYDYISRAWKVAFALLNGTADDAERLAADAYALAPHVQGIDANALIAGQLFFVRRAQNRLEEIVPAIESFVATNPLATWRAGLTLALAETGRLDDARRSWDLSTRAGLEAIPRDMWWLTTTALLSEAACRLGDATRAALLYEMLSPYAGLSAQLVFTVHLGPVERYLGLLAAAIGEHDRAALHLSSALRRCTVAGLHGLEADVRSELERLGAGHCLLD
jgi:DNA-binding SARP family transcriptional activator